MAKYRVTVYGGGTFLPAILVEAEDAAQAIRASESYRRTGLMTHRLGGAEFQANWQGDPERGRYGIEAVHAGLDEAKIKELEAVRLHDDRRRLAFDLIHDGHA